MSDAGCDAAFRATTYRVDAGEALYELRVGIANAAFDTFLRRRDVSCWALITAYNPGAMVSDAANQLAHGRLGDRLRALEWTLLPACNVPDHDVPPAEPGFMLLQVGESEVRELAAEFFQQAVLCGTIGDTPRLVYISAATRFPEQ